MLEVQSIVLVVFMLIGAAFCVWAAASFWRGLRTQSWPSVEGTVIRSWVLQRGANVGRNDSLTASSRARYSAEIEYGYVVGGKAMRGDRIAIEKVVGSLKRDNAEAQVAKWPENAKVRVYYSPSDPSACVLIPGPNWRAVLYRAIFGAWFLGIPVFFLAKI